MQDTLTTYQAVFCDHLQIAPCCESPDCGHYSCPCGIYWDDGAWGSFFEDGEMYLDDFGPADVA